MKCASRTCRRPRKHQYRHCESCLESFRNNSRRCRAEAKRDGFCPDCQSERPEKNFITCRTCLDKNKAYRIAERDRLREIRRFE